MILRSANELLLLARRHMLDGREPKTREDWLRVTNFIAAQIEPDMAFTGMEFIRLVLAIPLSSEDVRYITERQVEARTSEAN